MVKRSLFLALFLFLLLAAAGGYLGYRYLHAPLNSPGESVTIHIRPGQSFAQIVAELHEQRVISHPQAFTWLAKLTGKTTSIKAGEFRIDTGWSRRSLLEHLHSGQVVLHKLNIPEGLTWWETAQRVDRSGLASYSQFSRQVRNATLLQRFDIPAASAEGFLFPETYHLPRTGPDRAQATVKVMLQEFWNQTDSHLWPKKRPEGERLLEVVTLASLVEKETAVSEERRRIAGVYRNRLERGMRLQCDPTVIYGLGPDFDGNLTKKDLQDRGNAYNTYAHSGLPPGPICSPGLASLEAALHPEKHAYYYFVAKGDGSHKFSKTLREHNQAVRKYQLR
jgi:UPF0755 protein